MAPQPIFHDHNDFSAGGGAPAVSKDSLLRALSSIQSLQEDVAHDPLQPWREAAAVLSAVDLAALNLPDSTSTNASSLDLLPELIRVSDTSEDTFIWALPTWARREALKGLATRDKMRAALAANIRRPQTEVQRMLTRIIVEQEAPSVDTLSPMEAQAYLTVASWLTGILEDVPSPNTLRQSVESKRDEQDWRHLADDSFTGRVTELDQIYRHIQSREPKVLFVGGPGGIGKSTLMARALIRMVAEASAPKQWLLLDFDHPAVHQKNPLSLLVYAAQQISRKTPGLESLVDPLVRRWLGLSSAIDSEYLESTPVRPEDILGREIDEFVRLLRHFQDGNWGEESLLFLVDTFEEVQYFGNELEKSVLNFFNELCWRCPWTRVVICGRSMPSFQAPFIEELAIPGLPTEDAKRLLEQRIHTEGGVDPKLDEFRWNKLLTSLDGNPLTLRLAATVMAREGAQFLDDPHFVEKVQSEVLQRYLYTRILGHLGSEKITPLAIPGLVLRKLTPEIILKVLATPCGMIGMNAHTAEELFNLMEKEVSLVSREHDGSLRHRPDVRRVMLKGMPANLAATMRKIDGAAVRYWATQSNNEEDPLRKSEARAEEIYHRLRLGENGRSLNKRWLPGAESHFPPLTLEEFEPGSLPRRWLADRLDLGLTNAERAELPQDAWEQQVSSAATRLLQAGKAGDALSHLRMRPHRLPGSDLWILETRALLLLNQTDEALRIADRGLEAYQRQFPALSMELLLLIAWLEERRLRYSVAKEALGRAFVFAQDIQRHPRHEKRNVRSTRDRSRIAELRVLLRETRIERLRALGEQEALSKAKTLFFIVADNNLSDEPALLREAAAELGNASPNALYISLSIVGDELFESLTDQETRDLATELEIWEGKAFLGLRGARGAALRDPIMKRFTEAIALGTSEATVTSAGMQRRLTALFRNRIDKILCSQYGQLNKTSTHGTLAMTPDRVLPGHIVQFATLLSDLITPSLLKKAAITHLEPEFTSIVANASKKSFLELTTEVLSLANQLGQVNSLMQGLREAESSESASEELALLAEKFAEKPLLDVDEAAAATKHSDLHLASSQFVPVPLPASRPIPQELFADTTGTSTPTTSRSKSSNSKFKAPLTETTGPSGSNKAGSLSEQFSTSGGFKAASLARASFHFDTALSLALASQLAYSSSEDTSTRVLSGWSMATCDVVESDDAQCFVARWADTVLVAFRGASDLGDWLSNLNAISVSRPYGTVHHDFFSAFQSVKERLEAIITKFPQCRVVLTGHSKGGALAVIAAAEWHSRFDISWIHTHGQPAVGKKDFQDFMKLSFDDRYVRFVNDADIVPRLPPFFVHSGKLIHLVDDTDTSGGLESMPPSISQGTPSISDEHFNLVLALLRQTQMTRELRRKVRELTEGISPMDASSTIHAEQERQQTVEGLFPSISDHNIDRYVAKIAARALADPW